MEALSADKALNTDMMIQEDLNGGMTRTGTVTQYLEEKGYGFITPDDGGNNVFIHIKQCNGAESLRVGDEVDFEEAWNDRQGRMQGENCIVRRYLMYGNEDPDLDLDEKRIDPEDGAAFNFDEFMDYYSQLCFRRCPSRNYTEAALKQYWEDECTPVDKDAGDQGADADAAPVGPKPPDIMAVEGIAFIHEVSHTVDWARLGDRLPMTKLAAPLVETLQKGTCPRGHSLVDVLVGTYPFVMASPMKGKFHRCDACSCHVAAPRHVHRCRS